jgi:hypothetical protein
MNIPNFEDSKIVDENGRLTPVWRNILNQLFTELQTNASEEGLYVPVLSSQAIEQLESSTGALVYNSDTKKFMCCEDGAWKTITTS